MDDPFSLIEPGSLVLIGQGTAEPRSLTRELVRRRHEFPGLRLFLGAVFSDTYAPTETDGIAFSSYGAIGKAGALAAASAASAASAAIAASVTMAGPPPTPRRHGGLRRQESIYHAMSRSKCLSAPASIKIGD